MKLLDRLFGGRLSTAWEVSPGATVWKLEVTRGGKLVGEARDLEAKRMTLFAVDLELGRLVFSGLELEEPWWAALDNVIGETAIVHRYPKPDMPNVSGTWAVDVATGEIQWADPHLTVICGTNEIMLAQRGASQDVPRLVFLDASSGALLHDADDDHAETFRQACDDTDRWYGWTSAEELRDDDPKAIVLLPIIDRALRERRGPIEVAEHNGFVVVSAYVRSTGSAEAMLKGQLDNVLLIIESGRVVYKETIATLLPAPTGDSFFIRSGVLHFVRAGRTLVAIDLREPAQS